MRVRSFNLHTLHPGNRGKNGGIHPYGEMLHIAEGAAVLEWMGVEYNVPSPSLFLLPANTPHRLVRISDPLRFWYVELETAGEDDFVTVEQALLWNRLQSEGDTGAADMSGVRQALGALTATIEQMATHRGAYDEEVIVLDVRKTIRLVRNYLRARLGQMAGGEEEQTTKDLIQSLMRFMETNYADPIDLSQLSARVHLNSSYLVRAFKHTTGVTPMQYLNKLRLYAATSFLLHTDMPVQHIAEVTGFNSIHYFSRSFKQKYGESPMKWRENQRHKA